MIRWLHEVAAAQDAAVIANNSSVWSYLQYKSSEFKGLCCACALPLRSDITEQNQK